MSRETTSVATLIDGVRIKKLKVIPDERGRLMEMIRRDDPEFTGFGQIYMTTGYPGIVKGWHYHKVQLDNFVVVKGMIKLVLYDQRDHSPTHRELNELFLGEHSPIMVQIPPWVLHGFKAIGDEEAILINLASEPYNYQEPDEFRIDPHGDTVPYRWAVRDG